MTPSKELLDFVKEFEGFRSTAYRPLPTDRWTVGFGSTFIEGRPVVEGQTVTLVGAEEALFRSLREFGDRVAKPGLPSNVLQKHFDAVVSLVYNIGVTTFGKSQTGSMFYAGHDISNRFALFNRSGGQVIQGLTNRRNAEKNIYVNGIYAP